MGNCGFRDSKTDLLDYKCPSAPRLQRRHVQHYQLDDSMWSLPGRAISTDTINTLSEPVHPLCGVK